LLIIILFGEHPNYGVPRFPRSGYYSIAKNRPAKNYPIPAGSYNAHLGNFKGKYPDVEIDTPGTGFDDIEIHRGNTIKDTEGCILVGKLNDKGNQLTDSTSTL